jgi:hypothetical protein
MGVEGEIMKRTEKKLVSMRLSRRARAAQARLAERTGKTKTTVTEEALLLQEKTLGLGPAGGIRDEGGNGE